VSATTAASELSFIEEVSTPDVCDEREVETDVAAETEGHDNFGFVLSDT